MTDAIRNDGTLPSGQPRAAPEVGTASLPVDRDRQPAFEYARRAAIELGQELAENDDPDGPRCPANPEAIERYRWLLVAMGTGLAIASLAGRGYAMASGKSTSPWYPTTRALDWVGIVWFGVGLPSRCRRRWASMEQDALQVDIAALPQVRRRVGTRRSPDQVRTAARGSRTWLIKRSASPRTARSHC